MKRMIVLAAAMIAAAVSFPSQSSAETVYLKSAHSGLFVGTSNGRLAANVSADRAAAFDILDMDSQRIAFRSVNGGRYVRAGDGAFLESASQNVRTSETFYLSRLPGGTYAIRSALNGKLVRAGVGRGSLLAAVSVGKPQAWERFEIVPAAASGQSGNHRPGVSHAITGVWKVKQVAAHQTGYLTDLAPHLFAASRVEIQSGGNLNAMVGCNRMNATVSQNGASWNGGHFMSTKILCRDRAAAAVERSFTKAAQDAVRVALSGNRLTLRNSAGDLVLVMVR